MSAEPRSFEPIPGYHFRDPALLDQALTHRSFTQETSEPAEHNERFEFLGDAVLGFLVSEGLMARYPSYSEGQLTKLKAYLVSAANLVDVARQLDLGSYLRLGKSSAADGRKKRCSSMPWKRSLRPYTSTVGYSRPSSSSNGLF